MTTDQKRVRRGARLLDRVRPGWADEIDTGRLAVWSGEECVLGQLYGNYPDGRDIVLVTRNIGPWMFLKNLFWPSSPLLSTAYGFTSPGDWRPLNAAWLAEVASRRMPAAERVRKQIGAATAASIAARETVTC